VRQLNVVRSTLCRVRGLLFPSSLQSCRRSIALLCVDTRNMCRLPDAGAGANRAAQLSVAREIYDAVSCSGMTRRFRVCFLISASRSEKSVPGGDEVIGCFQVTSACCCCPGAIVQLRRDRFAPAGVVKRLSARGRGRIDDGGAKLI